MKRPALIALLFAAAFARAQVKMDVLVNGQKAGTATLAQRITEKGGKIVQLGMVLDTGDDKITVRSESSYDANGAPTRMFQETVTTGKTRDRREVIVNFDQDGANVVQDVNGDRTTKHVSVPAGAAKEDASEFWFVRDHPQVGITSTSLHFNVDSLNWDTINTVYKGVRPITVDGKRVIANVTESEQGKAYVDSTGLPLRLELTNAIMERVWDKT